jgi:endonuclease YncB( thermonuclease family)
MRRLPVFSLLILTLVCPGPALAAARPACAGPVEIAAAQVVRVERNGVLVLSDGRAVELEGIRMPLSPQDKARPGDKAGAEALSALRDLTADASVTFTAVPPKEDRYDRVRAQGFAGDVWLQAALLERGLARVAISPDRGECARELQAAEARGRGGKAGVWTGAAASPYRVRGPQDMRGTVGTFQVVEGWVTNVGRSSGRIFIDFGDDWQRGFSATIAPEDRGRFREIDPARLIARHVRIRGMVQDYRGRPEIALSNPAQIEILN